VFCGGEQFTVDSVMFENSIVYLTGLAGVGKRTIGQAICDRTGFRLIDNHRINNVVFPFFREEGHVSVPQEIWEACDAIREIALETMVSIGNRDFNYVFTNCLKNDDAEDLALYKKVENAAERMEATFLPVRLLCDIDENKRRIVMPDRNDFMKSMDINLVDKLNVFGALELDHPHAMTLDITDLSVEDSVGVVLAALAAL